MNQPKWGKWVAIVAAVLFGLGTMFFKVDLKKMVCEDSQAPLEQLK